MVFVPFLTADTRDMATMLDSELPGFLEFYRAYVECALWSSTDDDGEPMDTDGSLTDLPSATVKTLLQDTADFYRANLADVSVKPGQAGHDFWLTRNGHGAGFWDGDWPKEVGTRLTEKSKPYGGCNLYFGDDGLIYAQ